MTVKLSPSDSVKLAAAYHALEHVASDMRIGLGTGSTASWFVRLLAQRVQQDALDVVCVATSSVTTRLAQDLGLEVIDLDEAEWLDLTVDGADEFDPHLRLIKGAGGALLQEKIVASASDRMVVIGDESKRVETLGAFALPVEIVRFGWDTTRVMVQELLEEFDFPSRRVTVRGGEEDRYVTDEGHHIIDLHLERIPDPETLSAALLDLPGVVETGLFIDIATQVIVGQPDGTSLSVSRGGDERVLRLPNETTLGDIARSVT